MLHNCDLCGSHDYQVIECAKKYIGDNTPPVVCMNCGFVYIRERRTSKAVAEEWTDHLYPGKDYSPSWPMVRARLWYVAEWFDQEEGGWEEKTVIEIGAGTGEFLQMVRDRGAFPQAIEPSPANCRKLRAKNINAVCASIDDMNSLDRFDLAKFDVTCILWTLENCTDCITMLKMAAALTQPEGKIIVATGSRILVPFKKPLSMYFSHTPADTHAFRFSANSLARAMVKAGISPLKVNRYYDGDWMILMGDLGVGRSIDIMADKPTAVLRHFEQWDEIFP